MLGEDRERTTNRARRGVVPVQNRRTPSSVKIRYAQWNEERYSPRAPRLCIRVLITSSGIVVYTVTSPAAAPSANVVPAESGAAPEAKGDCRDWTSCLSVV